MAHDRFITFPKGKQPSLDDLEKALRAYLNGIGEEYTRHDEHLLSVKLPGKPRIVATAFPDNEWLNGAMNEARYIEVDTSATLDIMTRRQDEFTHAVAEGFSEFCARYWGGKREP